MVQTVFSKSLTAGSLGPESEGLHTPLPLGVGSGVTQSGALVLNFVNFRINLRGCWPSRNPGGVGFNFTDSQGTSQKGLGGWGEGGGPVLSGYCETLTASLLENITAHPHGAGTQTSSAGGPGGLSFWAQGSSLVLLSGFGQALLPQVSLLLRGKKMGSLGSSRGRWEVRGQRNIYPAQLRPFAFLKQETTSRRLHPLSPLVCSPVFLHLQGRQGSLTHPFLSSRTFHPPSLKGRRPPPCLLLREGL